MLTVDIAVGQEPRGEYVLVDFLVAQGRLVAWGFASPAAVRAWVAENPPALVNWRWRDGIYVDNGFGAMVPA